MNEEVRCPNCSKPLRDDELEVGRCSRCGEVLFSAPGAGWQPYKNGTTIGKSGSEDGVIIREDQYNGAIRLTLERDCRNIPFAITCGIVDWLVHTCYFSTRAEADNAYKEMQWELVHIYDLIPTKDDAYIEEESRKAVAAMVDFIHRF